MPSLPDPMSVLDRVKKEIERNTRRATNGIKLATGATRPNLGQTPMDVVWRQGSCELWHYRNDDVTVSPPLLIVFSLVSRSYILDLTPGNSFVEKLLEAGFDVYLLDWGVPDERDAGNLLEDYTDGYLPAGIRRVCELSGADEVNLLGYCFGGVLTLLHAAHHPDSPLRSLTVMATPVDYRHMGGLTDTIAKTDLDIETVFDENGNVPPQVIFQGFRMLTPTAEVTSYVNLWEKLWSDEYVAAHQAMTTWGNDHIPFPGAAMRQFVDMLIRGNGFMTDQLVLGGDRVHLSDIRTPFLSVLAKRDHIVPPDAASPAIDLVGSTDKHELRLDGGHIGLVVGRTAARTTIPTIIEFLRERSEVAA